MGEKFSSAIKLTDLDDFITPSQACVKPNIINKKGNQKNARIEVRKDGTYLEIGEDGNSEVLETAKITLNDCLACSGCITSAESVLVTAQSTQEFMSNLNKGKTVVVSISPQSRASIAAYFHISAMQAHRKLITLFTKHCGVDYVFDTSFSREFSLMESAAEFVARYKKTVSSPLPMLASACPGWICYAEKSHGNIILPYISSTKSPQQIMGTLVKYYLPKKINKPTLSADQIYHTTVMPCYDKKLEASRDDFYNDILQTRDVDCVLATTEIIDIISEKAIDFLSLEESPIEPLFTNISKEGQLFGNVGGSGGYLEYIFKYAAKELFGVQVDKIEYKASRNSDFQTTTLEVDGKTVLTFAVANGFRNIQNVVRKIKSGTKCPYDFVEVMACPGGCLNGGGQIRPTKGISAKELLKTVDDIYNQQTVTLPHNNEVVKELYKMWFDGVFSPTAHSNLHTLYHTREQVLNPLAIKW